MSQVILDSMVQRYPALGAIEHDVTAAFELMKASFGAGGKLLVCGNGGSAADAEHIAGELMKGFLKRRPLPREFAERMDSLYGQEGVELASKLQGALPTMTLTSLVGLTTAFNNDVDPSVTFAQQVSGYGMEGDVLLGISTSGNSRNVILALMVARAKGLRTIGLLGEADGSMACLCDVCIRVPSTVTYQVQEYHLPVYHCLCAMLEEAFFEV